MGTGDTSSITAAPLQIMPHDNQIGIIAYHHDGVFQGFALGGTGHFRVGKPYDARSQTVSCRFKTQPCPRRRFKKQSSHDFTLQQLAVGMFPNSPAILSRYMIFFLGMVCNSYQTPCFSISDFFLLIYGISSAFKGYIKKVERERSAHHFVNFSTNKQPIIKFICNFALCHFDK